MNARQKAKYYKRKCEELDEELYNIIFSPKFPVTNYKVDTLRFQRIYPENLVVKGREDILEDVITRDLVNELVSQMDKYVTVQMSFEPHLNSYKITADVKVVRN